MVRPKSTTIYTLACHSKWSGERCVDERKSALSSSKTCGRTDRYGTRGKAIRDKDERVISPVTAYEAVLNPLYSQFESRKKPRSARIHRNCKPIIQPSTSLRSKSTALVERTSTAQSQSPNRQRFTPMTLTPTSVSPTLTKHENLNVKPQTEARHEVFCSFKAKLTKSKSKDESDPSCSDSKYNTHGCAQLSSRTAVRAVSQGGEGILRPSSRPHSSRHLFCKCPSGQTKFNVNYSSRMTVGPSGYDEFVKLMSVWRGGYGLHWIQCSAGELSSRAVEAGHTRSGEPLYIARTKTPDRATVLGTFCPSSGMCYVAWRGVELATDQYELLCYRSRIQAPTSLVTTSPNLVDTLKLIIRRR